LSFRFEGLQAILINTQLHVRAAEGRNHGGLRTLGAGIRFYGTTTQVSLYRVELSGTGAAVVVGAVVHVRAVVAPVGLVIIFAEVKPGSGLTGQECSNNEIWSSFFQVRLAG